MNKEVKIKEIIFCSIFILVVIILLEIFVVPIFDVRAGFISKLFEKITVSQKIAPNRLYVNVWRIAKNYYVDETMNNQNWKRWKYKYIKHIKTAQDAEIAINTMLASLNDPYTKFLRSDLFEKQKIILNSKITGIGIIFKKSGNNIVVNYVLDNSPAQHAGILAGDVFISVNGAKFNIYEFTNLIDYIENPQQDNIELTFMRSNLIFTKKLKKKEINIKTMYYRITEDNIGIVTISNIMGENAIEDFKDILIKTNNTKALIIDLRDNYGGIFANAIVMANYMMDKAEIVSVASGMNSGYKIYSADERIFKEKPLIILINNKTASAAEILAGTLKVNANAILLGENSFGKNSIQHVIPFQNASGLIITTDKYILPDGNDIYSVGLIPDIYVKQNNDKKDNQKDIALSLLRDILEKRF